MASTKITHSDITSTIAVVRDSYSRPAEPYVYYDDQHDEPGWVLRYSLSDECGQCHLDEPLDVEDVDAPDETLLVAARAALRYVGV